MTTDKTTFAVMGTSHKGQKAALVKIYKAHKSPAIRDAAQALGFDLEIGVSNCYQLVCETSAKLAEVQAAMRPFFDAKGVAL